MAANKIKPPTNTTTGTQNCTSVNMQANIPRFSLTQTSQEFAAHSHENTAQEDTTVSDQSRTVEGLSFIEQSAS
jgi:hypothetical protein